MWGGVLLLKCGPIRVPVGWLGSSAQFMRSFNRSQLKASCPWWECSVIVVALANPSIHQPYLAKYAETDAFDRLDTMAHWPAVAVERLVRSPPAATPCILCLHFMSHFIIRCQGGMSAAEAARRVRASAAGISSSMPPELC
jgi:hypothetical protein